MQVLIYLEEDSNVMEFNPHLRMEGFPGIYLNAALFQGNTE